MQTGGSHLPQKAKRPKDMTPWKSIGFKSHWDLGPLIPVGPGFNPVTGSDVQGEEGHGAEVQESATTCIHPDSTTAIAQVMGGMSSSNWKERRRIDFLTVLWWLKQMVQEARDNFLIALYPIKGAAEVGGGGLGPLPEAAYR